jgi:hypothetical protein
MSGTWTVEYLENGGPGARQLSGWYACTHTKSEEPRTGMLCTFAGPFDSEEEAKVWVKTTHGVEAGKPESLRDLGRRLAIEREERFWSAFLNETGTQPQ